MQGLFLGTINGYNKVINYKVISYIVRAFPAGALERLFLMNLQCLACPNHELWRPTNLKFEVDTERFNGCLNW